MTTNFEGDKESGQMPNMDKACWMRHSASNHERKLRTEWSPITRASTSKFFELIQTTPGDGCR
ncbi:hypothetical protein N806_33035 [Rhodococcus sp. P27]|nr:hypothetical protein N806_33035 [Rhodococcus sp. P27]RAL32531.1 hypothetical protein CVN56_19245 [Rhodococcus sp. AQ5-07]